MEHAGTRNLSEAHAAMPAFEGRDAVVARPRRGVGEQLAIMQRVVEDA